MLTLSPSGLLSSRIIDIDKYVDLDPTYISRYLILAGIIDSYRYHKSDQKLKILEVGGSGSILSHFIDTDLTIIDILPNRDKLANYIQGSALAMPFADKSYDMVISSDVLEHIPNDDRTAFLKELSRVTKDIVVVAAPFNLPGVRSAEISANNFYKDMIGEDHRWLAEHLVDELPNLNQTKSILENKGMETGHFCHTTLYYWQLITRTGFILAHYGGKKDFVEKIRSINRHYMEKIMSEDFSSIGYRTFIIASKKHEIDIKLDDEKDRASDVEILDLLTEAIATLL